MLRGLREAAQGMVARQTAQDIIANNLANANSTGFQREMVAFSVRGLSGAAGAAAPNATDLQPRVTFDDRPGVLQQTQNPNDVALDGRGYFMVKTPAGPRLWRGGTLRVSPAGALATATGDALLGIDGKPLVVGKGASWTVAQDGTFSAAGKSVGRALIQRPSGAVKHEGASLVAAQSVAKVPAGSVRVMQGYLEHSNVDALHEMVEMIAGVRAYEASQKAVTAQDQTLQNLFEVLSR